MARLGARAGVVAGIGLDLDVAAGGGGEIVQLALGLVHRLETTGSQARYEALTTPHHHFVCDRCGQVIDFCWPDFDALQLPPPPDGAGLVARTSVIMHGQCAACLQAEAEGRQD